VTEYPSSQRGPLPPVPSQVAFGSLALPRRLLIVISAVLLVTGCVSNRYKAAPKDTPQAPELRLEGLAPELSVGLRSVVVFRGPGSWKREAYWDEYRVTLVNRTDQPLQIDHAALVDGADILQPAGDEPWAIERRSREKLKEYQNAGKIILLGAGWGAAWFGSGVIAAGTAVGGGSATVVLASTAVFVGLPVLGVGTLVRSTLAKADIEREFERRRLHLPLTLGPHESKSGSLFFAVTPGPRRLLLTFPGGDQLNAFSLPLAPLAGLHLPPPASAAVPPAN
jgi:hypothetical protein